MEAEVVSGIAVALIMFVGYLYYRYSQDEQSSCVPATDNCSDISEEPKPIPDDFVSSQCVTHLRNANIKTLYHLNKFSKDELMNIDYIGDQRAEKIRNRLEQMEKDDFFQEV